MYARPAKANHLETILYEIDMLDYCFQKLREHPAHWLPGDECVYLECFLLHYRNLLDFFRGKPRTDDLNILRSRAWGTSKISQQDLDKLKHRGAKLAGKYYQELSKYLQHCTTRRYEADKEWDEQAMYNELKPILTEFRELVGRKDRVAQWPDPLLGMFADEPDLMDEIVGSAMRARESHPLRRSGG